MIFKINYPDDKYKKYDELRYPAGEIQTRLTKASIESLQAADEVFVTATITDGEVMGLVQLTGTLWGAQGSFTRKTLILPYLPYGRADRRFVTGDCFGLRGFARAINNLGYDRVVTLDVHSKISETEIPMLTNVSAAKLIAVALEDISSGCDPERNGVQIILPDEGANRYGFKGPQCSKHRDPATGALSGFTLPEGLDLKIPQYLIVDDICDGGGTFNGIAEAFEKIGYNGDLYLYVTHGIFSKGFTELKKHFKHIYTTDSFPKTPWYGYEEMVTRIPAGGVILDAITTRSEQYELASIIENWKSHPVHLTKTIGKDDAVITGMSGPVC